MGKTHVDKIPIKQVSNVRQVANKTPGVSVRQRNGSV